MGYSSARRARPFTTVVLVGALATGCAGGRSGGAGAPPGPTFSASASPVSAPTASGGGSRVPSAGGGTVTAAEQAMARRVAGALPTTGTVDAGSLPGVLARLPGTLRGATASRTDASVTYTGAGRTLSLEVMEAQDLYGAGAEQGRGLLDRLVRDQQISVVSACPSTRVPCVVGGLPDGTYVAVWTPPDSPLIVAAIGPQLVDVEALVRAWQGATT